MFMKQLVLSSHAGNLLAIITMANVALTNLRNILHDWLVKTLTHQKKWQNEIQLYTVPWFSRWSTNIMCEGSGHTILRACDYQARAKATPTDALVIAMDRLLCPHTGAPPNQRAPTPRGHPPTQAHRSGIRQVYLALVQAHHT